MSIKGVPNMVYNIDTSITLLEVVCLNMLFKGGSSLLKDKLLIL